MTHLKVNLKTINKTIIGIGVNFSTHSATLSETALVNRQHGLRKQMVKKIHLVINH